MGLPPWSAAAPPRAGQYFTHVPTDATITSRPPPETRIHASDHDPLVEDPGEHIGVRRDSGNSLIRPRGVLPSRTRCRTRQFTERQTVTARHPDQPPDVTGAWGQDHSCDADRCELPADVA